VVHRHHQAAGQVDVLGVQWPDRRTRGCVHTREGGPRWKGWYSSVTLKRENCRNHWGNRINISGCYSGSTKDAIGAGGMHSESARTATTHGGMMKMGDACYATLGASLQAGEAR
jgi:hypothetical protein